MKKIVEKIAVAGVLVKDDKALIIQRAADDDYMPELWEIPSGKREPEESTALGVKREVEEEIGIKVEVGEPIGSFKYKVEKPDETRNVTQICFLVKPIGEDNVKLSSEHQDFAWITEGEIDKYNITEETKEIIRKALKL